jgi:hypothetical protein
MDVSIPIQIAEMAVRASLDKPDREDVVLAFVVPKVFATD